MRLKPLVYKIATYDSFGIEIKTVFGFAVDTMPRICVQAGRDGWKATDYDTGYGIGGWYADRSRCIAVAIKRVAQNPAHYAVCQASALARLAEEGLL